MNNPIHSQSHMRAGAAEAASPHRHSLAALAAAAFFAGAMALVNPAIADECDETTELVRSAARDRQLSGELVARIEIAMEPAIDRQVEGDIAGCRDELTLVRQILQG